MIPMSLLWAHYACVTPVGNDIHNIVSYHVGHNMCIPVVGHSSCSSCVGLNILESVFKSPQQRGWQWLLTWGQSF
eukprot:jgi/Botrbrau1/16327/Bobra.0066s0094.1